MDGVEKHVGNRSVTAPLRERSAGSMNEASGICQRKEFLFILFSGRLVEYSVVWTIANL